MQAHARDENLRTAPLGDRPQARTEAGAAIPVSPCQLLAAYLFSQGEVSHDDFPFQTHLGENRGMICPTRDKDSLPVL